MICDRPLIQTFWVVSNLKRALGSATCSEYYSHSIPKALSHQPKGALINLIRNQWEWSLTQSRKTAYGPNVFQFGA